MRRSLQIRGVSVGGRAPLALIAGPCVIESRQGCLKLASRLVELAREESIPLIFKASYDKANRSSIESYRGPGIEEGLDILREVRERFSVPILTDVHSPEECARAMAAADVLQIPAFLCRQTDLVVAAAETGCVVNIKKGQFMAPDDMENVVQKVVSRGNRKVMITERGSCFGYNNLVADMRSLPILRRSGCPVVFDATHSVQRPGGGGTFTAGDGWLAPYLARAAVAVGCDALFVETHFRPDRALSDKANAIPFSGLRGLWRVLRSIDEVVS